VIWRFFDRHGITFKKSPRMLRRQQRRGRLKQRQDWFAAQLDLDPSKLVFHRRNRASTNLAPKADAADAVDGCAPLDALFWTSPHTLRSASPKISTDMTRRRLSHRTTGDRS